MANKTQFQTNNNELSELIEVLQGKAAGSGSSGGSVETCTVTFLGDSKFPDLSGGQVGYNEANGVGHCDNWVDGTIITVPINSVIFVSSISIQGSFTNATLLYNSNGLCVFQILGNAELQDAA